MDKIDIINELYTYLERTNQIARSQDWQELADNTLQLLCEICQGDAVVLFWPRSNANHAQVCVETGLYAHQINWDMLWCNLQASGLNRPEGSMLLDHHTTSHLLEGCLQEGYRPANMALFITARSQEVLATFTVLNARNTHLDMANFAISRLITELEKAELIETSRQREKRIKEFLEIKGQIAASLDENLVLRVLLEKARNFLEVEATSLFLVDEEQNDLVLSMASQTEAHNVEKIRVPIGKGIIGYVVETGETVIVDNVHQDQRHYRGVDQRSGFHTRSILAVPLVAQSLDLGRGRGVREEKIIGGLEAINKKEGHFQEEDIELMQILARQAATAWMMAHTYDEAEDLFDNFIQALIKALDIKDNYSYYHTLRVSNFSMAIATELGFSQEDIHHIRRGSLLHDIGKILVSDTILKKKDKLEPAEREEMNKHAEHGANIIGEVRQLHFELPAISCHHERIDGTGYPKRLKGDQIPIFGRIVAVADVFDALTSNRSYRKGSPAAEIIGYLHANAGTHFDPLCVDALERAYQKGKIHPESEENLPI